MTTKADDRKTDRRNFLKLAGLGSVAGGAALVSGKEAEAAVADTSATGAGYSETDHVKAFYKTARF
ncbi:MAG: twin-arginine translocation signal domain-containing protein [Alphaproteobacteria bacterium]|jgi:hypothetical protein|nr:twin-arginine translocation signal domain-containing protein [Alphaproteobacteria bacterium]MBU0806154.1 twin-arginine translocation signal domain-containing protein [Alphaproteobacteria bacterium]MBU0874235.1 twin-arginine translocation signal domain-containing protein [Alphaproteobacteria bacterium]MBU1400462.1 twin-arginine translocation signal domain-containing protein [Alphaproteobacteria bacterium]MBU1592926.1 twin-arginine translocation signal domain-containing protein [Alphaproteobac